ncbi:ubiquinone biosynthesis O-methyltransferase, mitochondrial isoform X1 [Falco rusticolus]|uniref:ubiquinone biosynthesis O-methyltransferase, mitochondrial isoform X1 n=2 Tax=Falco TaxID=8952 RepID=UPI001886700A|nr:ubiquinone biosynthesis O-methyltransferase, mitochondrial isoform X1 [Falco rusticolus]XP_055570952.1 ubiquinone biosynthesis O-methyltransferase, mitochondrial isoform X1 [Falco cherrug]
MWGGGGGAARAFTRALGRTRAAAVPPGVAGGDHAALSIQTGLRGTLQDYCCEIQLKSSSTLPEMKSSMLTVKRLFCTSHSSVDSKEMKKFQHLAHKWWDEEGEYSALHSMNDIRVPFIRDTLLNTSSNYDLGSPLSGVKILDVGCGGGLLSEPLGRLGASVTGIDPLEDNIRTAEQHKSFDPVLAKRIQYKFSSLEEIVEESMETFDVIVASEVVEHVADLEMFIKCCSQMLKPEGSLFITTISKTQLSYVLGIVVAEKIMGIVPEGTHEWEKFVPPEELEHLLELNGFSVKTVNGMLYNPLSGSWSWMESRSVNYALHAVKSGAQGQSSPTDALSEMGSEQRSATAGTAL